LTYSAFAFSGAQFLASKGVPVIGSAVDSGEWITDKNMFSVYGTSDFSNVWTQFGLFFKLVGVTNLASLGYSISPSSSQSAKSAAISAETHGIKIRRHAGEHHTHCRVRRGSLQIVVSAPAVLR
jgi:branched-chain amino acid transport system substrate-binding protein